MRMSRTIIIKPRWCIRIQEVTYRSLIMMAPLKETQKLKQMLLWSNNRRFTIQIHKWPRIEIKVKTFQELWLSSSITMTRISSKWASQLRSQYISRQTKMVVIKSQRFRITMMLSYRHQIWPTIRTSSWTWSNLDTTQAKMLRQRRVGKTYRLSNQNWSRNRIIGTETW